MQVSSIAPKTYHHLDLGLVEKVVYVILAKEVPHQGALLVHRDELLMRVQVLALSLVLEEVQEELDLLPRVN